MPNASGARPFGAPIAVNNLDSCLPTVPFGQRNPNKKRGFVMKIFNKILAMVLALMTVLVMLPVSAFADAWLDVTSQTKAENSTITVKVDVSHSHAAFYPFSAEDPFRVLPQFSALHPLCCP